MNNILNEQIKNLRILFFMFVQNRILAFENQKWYKQFFDLFHNKNYDSYSQKINQNISPHELYIMCDLFNWLYISTSIDICTTLNSRKKMYSFSMYTKYVPTFINIFLKIAFNTIRNFQSKELRFFFNNFTEWVDTYQSIFNKVANNYFFKNKRSKYNKLLTKYWFLFLSFYFDLEKIDDKTKNRYLYWEEYLETNQKIYNDLLEKFWEDYIKQWRIIYDNLTKDYLNLQYL